MNLRRRMELPLLQTAIVVPLINIFIQNLDHLIMLTSNVDQYWDQVSFGQQNAESVFDYIVVGSGSAGSIVASRLAENTSVKVLLLEAGGLPTPFGSIPTLSFFLIAKKSHDWMYRTVPQKQAGMGLNGQVVFWPAGKALGGSSSINGAINIRGNMQGYDIMAKRIRDPIWQSKSIFEFYKKVENYHGWFDKSRHGTNGDLTIESPTLVPMAEQYFAAGREMGYPTRDPNVEVLTEGFAPIEFYTKGGIRADAYRATLKKNMFRKNLIVRKFSHVTRLLFRAGSKNEVSGVQYDRHGKIYEATALRETILSAGCLSTPKILMLSGIGPKAHLEEIGIPVRVDLPVGHRLQDKYGALVGPFVVNRGQSFNYERDVNISSLLQWVFTGKGLVGSERTEGTFAILSNTAKQTGDTHAPDIHTYLMSHTPIKAGELFGKNFNFKPTITQYMEKSVENGDGFFQIVTMSRPIGTGTVKLKDKNPYSHLVIDPKYMENERDMTVLVEGIKFAVDLVERSKSMGKINAKLFPVPFPGCERYQFKSNRYYECVAKHATVTAYKYCGTTPIGTRNDTEAVVDSRFRVFGTKRLRVIDGSLLRINEVNTNDVTMRMIGELGAYVIKLNW